MKHLFTLSLLLLGFAGFSQAYFEQDFEAGMAPMTLIDNDGRTPAANVAAYTLAWNVVNPTFGNGTNVAISNSWYAPAGRADDWMITPSINIADANAVVKWQAKAQDATYPDGYRVLVSTTGTAVADFTNVLLTVAAENTDFTDRSASLAAFVGQDIHIAWQNNSNDMFLLLVDNIFVGTIPANDLELVDIRGYRFQEVGAQVAVTGTVRNRGAEPVTSFTLNWSDGTNNYTETVSGVNIPNGGTYDFTSDNEITIAAGRSYAVTADVVLAGDADLTNNDAAPIGFTAVSTVPSKKVVIEEATGTWCPWCPRGFDWMEYMAEEESDKFIGIAVHNDDPMMVTAYDSGLTGSAVFGGGFPGALADRVIDIDPSDMGDYVAENYNRVVPVGVGVTATYDSTTNMITINGTADFYATTNDIGYRFNIAITEDSLKGTSAGWAHANNYNTLTDPLAGYGLVWAGMGSPVPAAQMYYNHVARAILGGWDGYANSIPASIADGDNATINQTIALDATWKLDRMKVVLMVINSNDGTILNAEETTIIDATPSSVKDVEDLVSMALSPNPTNGISTLDLRFDEVVDAQVIVTNTLGQNIQTIDLGKTKGQLVQIDMTNRAAGTYFVSVRVGNQVRTTQLMVTK